MTFMQKLNALIKLGLALSLFAGMAHAQSANNGYPYSSLSGTPAAITVAPPYLEIGTTYYIPADNMFAATRPPACASLVYLNAGTPSTCANGANGNIEINDATASTTTWWISASGTASSEAVMSVGSQGVVAGSVYPNVGVWLYDSTNSKVYSISRYYNGGANSDIQLTSYTYGGSGTPSSGVNIATFGYGTMESTGKMHLKIAASGGNVTGYVSLDGGSTYHSIGTHSIGTVAKGGVYFQPYGYNMELNILSLNVQ